ncbi:MULTISPECIES: hypothetical protein [unclassified Sphingomonas]|uniref:hypothetical protein n=1 Tax=unclassified Sphingomonas TaxID=196159 RepID=UPI00226BAA49|nr:MULTISPECIES: hypothetical protein [unclassified Sphingomonas]
MIGIYRLEAMSACRHDDASTELMLVPFTPCGDASITAMAASLPIHTRKHELSG